MRKVGVTPTFFQAQVVIVEFFPQPVLGLVAGYFLNVASGKPLLGPLFGLDALREYARSLMPMFLSLSSVDYRGEWDCAGEDSPCIENGRALCRGDTLGTFDHRCRGT